MGMKNVNLFEQHVEKIVLGVAAAGALYMGFLATKPITIPDTNVSANQVEDRISAALADMDRTQQINGDKPPPKVPIVNYAEEYRKLASGEPLPQTLLAAAMPTFGPKGMAVTGGPTPPPPPGFQVATPTPVDPEGLTAQAAPQLVANLPVAGVAGQAPMPVAVGAANLATHDQNAVVIQGYIPVGKMLVEMANQDKKMMLPLALQKVVIARIKVERKERTPSGLSEAVEVTPAQGMVLSPPIPWAQVTQEEMPNRLTQVDGEFNEIVLPTFYVDEHGAPIEPPILTQPLPAQIQREAENLQDQLTKARSAINGQPAMALPTPAPLPTPGVAPSPGAPVPLLDVAKLRETVVPFCFWDETVQANHEYQYQVTVEYVNPTYKWNFSLKDPEMANQPFLTSRTVVIPTVVRVHSDLAFFVTGGGSLVPGTADHTASFKVFKKTNGKWYANEFYSQPGMNIAGRVALVDLDGQKSLDVDTGFTVVDVQTSSANVHVVMKDTDGNLVTRDSVVDKNDPQKGILEREVVVRQPVAPAVVDPATAPPVTTPRGSTTPPRTGTTTTPPRTPTPTPVRPTTPSRATPPTPQPGGGTPPPRMSN